MNIFSVRQLFLLGLLPLLLAGKAFAYTYTCTGKSGSPRAIAGNFGTVTISDATLNTAGQTFDNAAQWNTGSRIPVKCDEPSGSRQRRFSASSPLLPTDNDGSKQWFQVNEYLDTTINVSIQGNRYVPFKNVGGGVANDSKGQASMPAGSTGFLDLKIVKPFVGTTSFNNIHVADIFLSKQSGTYSTDPIAQVFLTGTVVVPQNCTVNAGAVVTVNLGTLYSTDFQHAGEIPANYSPKAFSFPVQCNYGASLANLTLRVSGTASTDDSNALQSDNPDVGVIITDNNGATLVPNDTGSNVPLQLNQVDDDNYSTDVTLKAYPVSTTGNTPAEGTFTTLALLLIDFA